MSVRWPFVLLLILLLGGTSFLAGAFFERYGIWEVVLEQLTKRSPARGTRAAHGTKEIPKVQSRGEEGAGASAVRSTSAGGVAGPHDRESARPAMETVPRRFFSVSGILQEVGLQPAGGKELVLQTPEGERPVWTDEQGRFSLALWPACLPATLKSEESGPVLYQRQSVPEREIQFLNLCVLPGVASPLFTLRSAAIESTASGVSLQIFGQSRLPEGCQVRIRLLAGGHNIQEGLARLAGDGTIGRLDVPIQGLYDGWYEIEVTWSTLSADPRERALVDTIVRRHPLPAEISTRSQIYIGRPEEEKKEQDAIRRFYSDALQECIDSRDLVLLAGAQLRGKKIHMSPERIRELRSHPAFATLRGLGESFDVKTWRRFIDEALPAAWKRYRDPEKIPYRQKYPILANHLVLLYEALGKYCHLESRLVYRARGLAPSSRDYVSYEFAPETERRLTLSRLKEYVHEIRRGLD